MNARQGPGRRPDPCRLRLCRCVVQLPEGLVVSKDVRTAIGVAARVFISYATAM
jgi:hypothetical protein